MTERAQQAETPPGAGGGATESLERYRIRYGLYKVGLGTTFVALFGAAFAFVFDAWQLSVEESRQQRDYVKDFLKTAINQDIELRIRLAEYFAHVTPDDEDTKAAWRDLYISLKTTRDANRLRINNLEESLLR